MHKEQQRQHLKSNNIISKLVVIVLSVVLLTGISLVPALQIERMDKYSSNQENRLHN
jgi:hypothetical protein